MAVGSHQRRGPKACVVAFTGGSGLEEGEEVGIGVVGGVHDLVSGGELDEGKGLAEGG